VQVAGRLDFGEWQAALREVEKLLSPQHRTSILLDAARFDGWEPGNWDDLSFRRGHDADIARLAIVSEPEWEDRMLMFAGKGLRRIEIEFFTPEQSNRARQWLESAT
jgi:hypothetical protein